VYAAWAVLPARGVSKRFGGHDEGADTVHGRAAGVGRRIARFRVMLAKGVTALLYRLVVASGDRGQRASAWAIADRRQRTSVLSPRWSTKAKPSRTLAAR
jgi:hypothetical protein